MLCSQTIWAREISYKMKDRDERQSLTITYHRETESAWSHKFPDSYFAETTGALTQRILLVGIKVG